MARPVKRTVDYFSHDTDAHNRRTCKILRFKFKNDGFAGWFILLEVLGTSDNLVFDTRNPADWQFLVAEMQMSEDSCRSILDTCAEIGAIDLTLWEKGVIWSQNFVNRLADVFKKRGQPLPQRPVITDAGTLNVVVSAPETPHQPSFPSQPAPETPQSTVKESTSNKTKETYPPISPEMKLSSRLKDGMLENDPAAKIPKDLQAWAAVMNKIIRLDNRTEQEVQRAIDYSQSSDFWKPNILSATKLRDKIPTLLMQADRDDAKEKNFRGEKKGDAPIKGVTIVR